MTLHPEPHHITTHTFQLEEGRVGNLDTLFLTLSVLRGTFCQNWGHVDRGQLCLISRSQILCVSTSSLTAGLSGNLVVFL